MADEAERPVLVRDVTALNAPGANARVLHDASDGLQNTASSAARRTMTVQPPSTDGSDDRAALRTFGSGRGRRKPR